MLAVAPMGMIPGTPINAFPGTGMPYKLAHMDSAKSLIVALSNRYEEDVLIGAHIKFFSARTLELLSVEETCPACDITAFGQRIYALHLVRDFTSCISVWCAREQGVRHVQTISLEARLSRHVSYNKFRGALTCSEDGLIVAFSALGYEAELVDVMMFSHSGALLQVLHDNFGAGRGGTPGVLDRTIRPFAIANGPSRVYALGDGARGSVHLSIYSLQASDIAGFTCEPCVMTQQIAEWVERQRHVKCRNILALVERRLGWPLRVWDHDRQCLVDGCINFKQRPCPCLACSPYGPNMELCTCSLCATSSERCWPNSQGSRCARAAQQW